LGRVSSRCLTQDDFRRGVGIMKLAVVWRPSD